MSLNERTDIMHLARGMANQGGLNEPFLTWYLETMTWGCFPTPGDLVVLYSEAVPAQRGWTAFTGPVQTAV